MKYEEKLQHYQIRYSLYNLSLPSRELVENDQFRCPCCGKITDISHAQIEVKEGKTLHRNSSVQGRIVIVSKKIDKVRFYVCDQCKKNNDSLDKDPVLVWSMLILAIVFLIGDFTFCIYSGIHQGDFSFIWNCVAQPFLLGIILYFVYCLILIIIRFLLSAFKYKNASTLDLSMITSMNTLSSGNALV